MEKITLSWATPDKAVLLVTYEDSSWNWEDFYAALKQQRAFIDGSPAPKVDVIIDTHKTGLYPKGGSLLSGVRKITVERHPRQAHTIIVGAHGLISVMIKVVEKLMGSYRQEFHSVSTIDDAMNLIERIRTNR